MKTANIETESKFTVPDGPTFEALRKITRLGQFELSPLGSRHVLDRYLDTADRRLFQAGFACRIRTVTGKRKLTVKSLAPAEGHLHRRQEYEAEIDSEQPQAWAETEPGRLVLAIKEAAQLETLFVLHQTRHQFHAYRQDRPVLEVSLDEVSLEDVPDSHSLELEAELIESGTETELSSFTQALQAQWVVLPTEQSKFEWALAKISQKSEAGMTGSLTKTEKSILNQIAGSVNKHLARRAMIILLSDADMSPVNVATELELTLRTVQHWQREFGQKRLTIFPEELLKQVSNAKVKEPPAETTPLEKPSPKKVKRKKRLPVEYPVRKKVGLEPTDSLAEAGRKVLGFHFARMLQHEPGTRLGQDIEALHDMRVATRRMRAAFRVFGPAYSPKKTKSLQKGLKRTARALGPVRDLDVFMEKLGKYQQQLPESESRGLDPLLETWRAERESVRDQMMAYLDGKRYASFKQKFLEFVETDGLGAKPIPKDEPVPYQLRHIVPGLIFTRYEAVCGYDTILDNASLATLHELRLVFKRFRYTLEYFKEILGDEAKAVIDDVKTMQDHLGDLNDADVASTILRDFLAKWEQYQTHVPLAQRQSPTAIVNYLNSMLEERHQLLVAFPEAWQHFNRPEFRKNLALAIAAL